MNNMISIYINIRLPSLHSSRPKKGYYLQRATRVVVSTHTRARLYCTHSTGVSQTIKMIGARRRGQVRFRREIHVSTNATITVFRRGE